MVLVLAVTPDKMLDKKIRDALGTEGWWVSQVEDRQSALRSAADHEPHLVLLDEDVEGLDDLVRVFGSRSGGPGAVVLSDDKESSRLSPGCDAVLEKDAENGQLLASVKKVMSQPHSPVSAAEIQSGEILSAQDIFGDLLLEVADEATPPCGVEGETTGATESETAAEERPEAVLGTLDELPEAPADETAAVAAAEGAEPEPETLGERPPEEETQVAVVAAPEPESDETVGEQVAEPTEDTDPAAGEERSAEPAPEVEPEVEIEERANGWFDGGLDIEAPEMQPEVALEEPAYPLETVEIPNERLTAARTLDADAHLSDKADPRPVWPTAEDAAPDLPLPPAPAAAVEPVEIARLSDPDEDLGLAMPDVLPEPLPPRSMRLPEPTQDLEPAAGPILPALQIGGDAEGELAETVDQDTAPSDEAPLEPPRPAEAGLGWKRFWLGVAAGLLVFAATSLLLRFTFGGEPWRDSAAPTQVAVPADVDGGANDAANELEELVAEELARREAELRNALVEEERRLQERLDEVDSQSSPGG